MEANREGCALVDVLNLVANKNVLQEMQRLSLISVVYEPQRNAEMVDYCMGYKFNWVISKKA